MEFVNCSQFVGQLSQAWGGMRGGREGAVLGIRTWASLLAISDTSYSQTMTMLLATSAHATHGVDYNWDDLLNMVHEKMVLLTQKRVVPLL